MSHEPPSSASPPAPVGPGHLDLDQLADLDEALLAPADAAAADAHLDECGVCRQRRADLRTTRALLSTLPADPMPPAVTSRLDAALAALPSTTIVPLEGKRRSWRAHPTMAGLGAAATVAALIGALVVARTSSHHDSSHQTGAAGAGSVASRAPLPLPPSTATGTKYTAANLARTVPSLLRPQQPAQFAQAPARSTPAPAAGAATANAVPAALTRLYTSSTALDACVRSVEAGGPPEKPLAVDFATYEGAPSLLIVLPGLDQGTIDAWFVGPGCTATNENLVTYKSVPTSSPAPSPGG